MGFGNDAGLAVLEVLQLTVAGGVAFVAGALSHWSEPTGSVGLNTRGGRRVNAGTLLMARGPGCSVWDRWTLSGMCPGASRSRCAPFPQSGCFLDLPRQGWGASGRSRLLSTKKLVLNSCLPISSCVGIARAVFWSMNGRGRRRIPCPPGSFAHSPAPDLLPQTADPQPPF